MYTNKKIKYKYLEILIASMIPLVFQVQLYFSFPSLFMYAPYILITVLLCIRKNILSYKIPKGSSIVSIILILSYIVIPFAFFTINFYNFSQNLIYTFLYILMINALIIVSNGITWDQYNDLMKKTLFFNSVILIFAIVTNINQVNSVNIISVFTGERLNRAAYKLGHPNFAAMFIAMEIVLMYIVFYKNRYKKTFFCGCIFFIIFLLSTGSRTAFFSLIVFFVTELLISIYNNKYLDKYLKNSIFFISLIFILFIIFRNNVIEHLISNSSGRQDSVIHNIAVLIKNKKIISGYGPVQITNLGDAIPELTISDNWYVTQTIRYGIIGLILVLSCVFIILKKGIKNLNRKNTYVISLIAMILFYSSAENALLVPGVIISWICWIIFYCNMEIYK